MSDGDDPSSGDFRELLRELVAVVATKADVLALPKQDWKDHAVGLGSFLLMEGREGGKSPIMRCWLSIRRNERERGAPLSSDEARKKLMEVALNALPEYVGSEGNLPPGYEIHERLRRTIRKMKLPVEMTGKRMLAFGFAEPMRLGDLDVPKVTKLLGVRACSGESTRVSGFMLPTEGDLSDLLLELRTIDPTAAYLVSDGVSLALAVFDIPTAEGGKAPPVTPGGSTEVTSEADLGEIQRHLVGGVVALDGGAEFPLGQHAMVLMRNMVPELLKQPGMRLDALAAEWGVSLQTVFNRRKAIIGVIREVLHGPDDLLEVAAALGELYRENLGKES